MLKQNLKTIATLLVITLIVGLFSINILEFTYASNNNENVNCQVVVAGYQQYSTKGNILNVQEKWYPEMSEKGVLEVLNNFGKVQINNIGVELKSINKDEITEDFLNYFNLTVEQVKFSGGGINIVNKIINEVTFKKLTENGHNLNSIITSYKGDSTYLRYTVKMNEEAPNSLMDVTADISFTIGIVGYDSGGGDDDDDDDDDDDVVKDNKHWAHDCIETLLKYGIIQGYPDGSIQPEDNITRAEAAVLIANALNIMPDDTSPYPYVDKSHPWYRGHVTSGSREDVVRGYLDDTFKPSKYISREEMTAMLIRGFEKKASESVNLPFVDQQKIADWAVEYVRAATAHKVIEGYPDKTFRPQRNITRAEAFTIICKLLELHHLHEVR